MNKIGINNKLFKLIFNLLYSCFLFNTKYQITVNKNGKKID